MSKPYRCFNQGEMQKFGQLFIAPLLHIRPPKQSLDEFLASTLFHKDERVIVRCKVTQDFTMPGLWKITPYTKVKDGAPREIKRGAECFVRYDCTDTPERVDIETYLGQGGREYVFEVTGLEFVSIKNFLESRGRGKNEFDRICPAIPTPPVRARFRNRVLGPPYKNRWLSR